MGFVATGSILYVKGYTYEGSVAFYLIPSCLLCLPSLLRTFTPALLAMGALPLMPALVWIQDGGVEAGNWHYPNGRFLLGTTHPMGDGPLRWTRLLWTGTEMPAIEYLFYPLMACFVMSTFASFVEHMPDSSKQRHPRLGRWFLNGYFVFSMALGALGLLFGKPTMDYNWYLISLGTTVSWLAVGVSRSFRALIETRLWFWWLLAMGCGFQPLWEFFHSCINHDWVYNSARTMPVLYVFNGAPVSVVQPFGYIAVTIMFPGVIGLLADHFPRLVKRDGKPGLGLCAASTPARGDVSKIRRVE